MHARFLHPARDRETAQSLAAIAAMGGKPLRALFQNLAHPVQGFHVVFERGMAEQPHLRDIRRAQPRHAALAFDGFDHRRFFTANVGARATTQKYRRQWTRRIFLQRRDFLFEDGAHAGVLVAQINIDFGNLHRPRGNDHAFEKTVRVAFEVVAILERARLAFVNIDRHHARARLAAHDAPLAPGGKSRAAQPAQAGMFHGLDNVLGFVLAAQARSRKRIAALGQIFPIGQVFGRAAPRARGRHQWHYFFHRCIGHRILPHNGDRPLFATPDARCRYYAHPIPQRPLQPRDQFTRATQFARQRIAHAHGQRGRRRFAFLDDIEMVIKARNLENLGHGEFHFARQRCDVRRTDVAKLVLNSVQVFDQQIAAARVIAEQRLHFAQCAGFDHTPLGLAAPPTAFFFDCALLQLPPPSPSTLNVQRSGPGRGGVRRTCRVPAMPGRGTAVLVLLPTRMRTRGSRPTSIPTSLTCPSQRDCASP